MVYIDPLSLEFLIKGNKWTTSLAKSQTKVTNFDQLKLIMARNSHTHALEIEEKEDMYEFSFTIPERAKEWKEIKKLGRNEKLRALHNLSAILPIASTRITYMIHPNNITFDENLMPKIIFRGARNLIPPYQMEEADLLKQYKCYCIALFSNTYTFDDLYTGSLNNALNQQFAREVNEAQSFEALTTLLYDTFVTEQDKSNETKTYVPRRQFRLYKQMSIWMTSLAVLVLGLLFYIVFAITSFQDDQLSAHKDFLAGDYGEVIRTLKDKKVKKLPHQAAYILAYSYVTVERLSDEERQSVMKNINLKSNEKYLHYWIYNGLGDFEESIDVAKFLDDPRLIVFGLVMKLEQVQNDPKLTGAERDEETKEIREELNRYTEEYDLIEEEPITEETSAEEEQEVKQQEEQKQLEAEQKAKEEAEAEKAKQDEEKKNKKGKKDKKDKK